MNELIHRIKKEIGSNEFQDMNLEKYPEITEYIKGFHAGHNAAITKIQNIMWKWERDQND